MLDSPVEVRFVFVHIDVVEWILSEPGVDGKSVLVRPFGYWRQCNGLQRKAFSRSYLPPQMYFSFFIIDLIIEQNPDAIFCILFFKGKKEISF